MRIVGRRVALLGFLLLSVSFFLPQVQGCNEPVIPARDVANGQAHLLLTLFAPFVFAFLGLAVYGIIAFVQATASIRRAKVERIVTTLWCVLCITLLLAVSAYGVHGWVNARDSDLFGRVFTVIALLTTATLVVIALRTPPYRRLALCALCCGVDSLAIFAFFILLAATAGEWHHLYHGIWLSATASLLIAGGATSELLALPKDLARCYFEV